VLQFSSIGSVQDEWLKKELVPSFTAGAYPAAAAAPGGAGGAGGAPRGTLEGFVIRGGAGPPAPKAGLKLRPGKVQLVWPTVDEVRDSLQGWKAGASIPGDYDNVSRAHLKPLWRRWDGSPLRRQRAMPHIKARAGARLDARRRGVWGGRCLWRAARRQSRRQSLVPLPATAGTRKGGMPPLNAASPDPTAQPQPLAAAPTHHPPTPQTYLRYDPATRRLPWMLVASHNLSGAAWGKREKEKQADGGQLHILSYELGALCLPSLEAAYRAHRHRGFRAWPPAPPALPAAVAAAAAGERRARQQQEQQQQEQHQQEQEQDRAQAPQPGAQPPAPIWLFAARQAAPGAAASAAVAGAAALLLPVPYPLPPRRYDLGPAGDKPWVVDGDASYYEGQDKNKKTILQHRANPGSLYL
jgi:hypothetical protein